MELFAYSIYDSQAVLKLIDQVKCMIEPIKFCSLCSQQQLRRCQSELNRQVKQSSSVIQEKVPFNDTSEYLVLSHMDKDDVLQGRHLF